MAKKVSWQQQFREAEAKVNVSVIDTAESMATCPVCEQRRLVFYVHLFREENRPIAALCKDCTIAHAGGGEKVYVKEAPGPWLRQRWEKDRAVPKASPARLEALKRARDQRLPKIG
jgi:hypothetical protein